MGYSWRSLAAKGETIYLRIKRKLLSYEGKFAAIDVESQEYFIGSTLLEAFHRAKNEYPSHKFHFVRIGHPAAVSHKHRTRP